MNPPEPGQSLFTCAELAEALKVSRQAIGTALADVPRSGQVPRGGNLADAWQLADLPPDLRGRLNLRAREMGHRDGLALLSRPVKPWQPAVPFAQCSPDVQSKTCKLQKVLQPFAEINGADTRTQAEWERDAETRYKAVFGHGVSGRWLRKRFKDVLDRAWPINDFNRVELYLPDNPARAVKAQKRISRQFNHEILADTLKSFQSRDKLNASDLEFLYGCAFKDLESLERESPGERDAILRSQIELIFSALKATPITRKTNPVPKVGIAPSREALAITLRRKFAVLREAGGKTSAIQDKRSNLSGNFRRPDFTVDVAKIRDRSIELDGNESLAHRQLRREGSLSPEFTDHFTYDVRRHKSRCPVRDEITPAVEMCLPLMRGPRYARMRGPWIRRDYKDVLPGDWFQADDFTGNNYVYRETAPGQFWIGRGQWLAFIDVRSLKFLHHTFIVANQFNSEHTKLSQIQTVDLQGLPRKGFFYENSVFAALLNQSGWLDAEGVWHHTGKSVASEDTLGFDHARKVLIHLGKEVRHTLPGNPRSKVIEGLGHIIQARQRRLPGNCGPSEMTHKMERNNDFIARCRSGKEHPGNQLLEVGEWTKLIDTTLAEYNAEPQNGQMLRGVSPDEMWATRSPLEKLPPEGKIFSATHCVETKVRQDGIVLRIRGQRRPYFNGDTGQWIGRKVLAWYNVECPQLLTVSDPDMKNFFTVESCELPAMSATEEQFAEIGRRRAAHMEPAKIIVGNILHPEHSHVLNDNRIDNQAAQLGRFHNDQIQQFETRQKRKKNLAQRLESTGRRLVELVRDVARAVECLEGLAKLDRQGSAGEAVEPQPVQYVLNTGASLKASISQYWSLWNQLSKLRPDLNRHALTRKSLDTQSAANPSPKDMTPAQRKQMIDVFAAILRDSKTAQTTP